MIFPIVTSDCCSQLSIYKRGISDILGFSRIEQI